MRETRAPRWRAAWPLTVPLFALLLASCGDDEPDKAAPASSAPARTPVATPTATPTPTPTATLRKAKNGTSLAACADGRCEVEVGVGDIIRFNADVKSQSGLAEMTVTSIGDMEIQFKVAHGSFGVSPPGSDDPFNINDTFSHTLIDTAGKRAVIRLAAPKPGAGGAMIS